MGRKKDLSVTTGNKMSLRKGGWVGSHIVIVAKNSKEETMRDTRKPLQNEAQGTASHRKRTGHI